MPIDRREFLGISLALVASLKAFPTQARERLAVSSYPFRSQIGKSRMNLQQFAETIVSKLNVPGIEPWSRHFESVDTDYVSNLAQSFKKAGLRVVNIPVDESIASYHKWVDAAVILGSPGIRVHLPRGDSATQMLKDLAVYGASKNIVINLENDEPESENPYRVLKVIETVNTRYLRSLPDFCNSMLITGDPEYNYKALQALFPHAYNISHVKDQESDKDKTYRVDLARIFAIAKSAGYKGYFSMEWEGEGDPYQGTQALIEASLKNLA